jgi:hypothetical protein
MQDREEKETLLGYFVVGPGEHSLNFVCWLLPAGPYLERPDPRYLAQVRQTRMDAL